MGTRPRQVPGQRVVVAVILIFAPSHVGGLVAQLVAMEVAAYPGWLSLVELDVLECCELLDALFSVLFYVEELLVIESNQVGRSYVVNLGVQVPDAIIADAIL